MPGLLDHSLLSRRENTSGHDGIRIGQVTHVASTAEVFVDFPGNHSAPVAAHILNSGLYELQVDDRVLLVVGSESGCAPIVLGSLADRLPTQEQTLQFALDGDASTKKEVAVDGKTITFTGREEIVMRCGKSSITLKKDGKILVKGTHLVSRASRTNKIKGSSVAIN